MDFYQVDRIFSLSYWAQIIAGIWQAKGDIDVVAKSLA